VSLLRPSFPPALVLPQLPRLVIPGVIRALLSNARAARVFLLFATLQLAMAHWPTVPACCVQAAKDKVPGKL